MKIRQRKEVYVAGCLPSVTAQKLEAEITGVDGIRNRSRANFRTVVPGDMKQVD